MFIKLKVVVADEPRVSCFDSILTKYSTLTLLVIVIDEFVSCLQKNRLDFLQIQLFLKISSVAKISLPKTMFCIEWLGSV